MNKALPYINYLRNHQYFNFIKNSWSLTWPILVVMFFNMFMNLTDVYVGGLLGKTVQASVGLANQTYYIFSVVVTSLTVGTISVISKIFGSESKNSKQLSSSIFSAIIFAIICSIIITLLSIVLAPTLISKSDMSEDVKETTITLIKIYNTGLFFNLMIFNFNGILRACKMMKYMMIAMVSAAILNMLLCFILSFKTSLGFKGIAVSTNISWIVAFIIILPVIVKLVNKDFTIKKDIFIKIFKISWPMGIIAFSWQLSSLVLYGIVAMLPQNSVEVMAAMTSGLRIESIIYMPAFAFNMANAVLVGNLMGENKQNEAFKVGLLTAAMGVSVIVILTIIVIIAAPLISNIISSKDASNVTNPIVLKETINYIRIVMISQPFIACNLIISGALSGAGDTKSLMKYTIFSLWVLRIPLAFVSVRVLGMGPNAVWWAMNITFLSQSILSGRRYLSKKWLT